MLHNDEAHIWLASPAVVEDPAFASKCRAILSDEERGACDRFHFERDRKIYLTAHALVRTVLSRYAPVAPEAWWFERNEHGRPEIVGGGALRFNLSHTRGLVACLVVNTVDAGVDVEHRRDVSLNVADRFFSPVEVAELRALPENEQRHRFYELWTLKEAYIKGRGMGLALSLGGFSFRLSAGKPGEESPPQPSPSLRPEDRPPLPGREPQVSSRTEPPLPDYRAQPSGPLPGSGGQSSGRSEGEGWGGDSSLGRLQGEGPGVGCIRPGEAVPTLTVAPELHDDGSEWQCGLSEPSPEHQLAWAIRTKGRHFDVKIETLWG